MRISDWSSDVCSSDLSLLPFLIPVGIFIAFFWFMQRRAQSQMGGIMSIGRSTAKTYSTERPGTTFADVAGYEGVKQAIKEVVDFLKRSEERRVGKVCVSTCRSRVSP